MKLEEAKYIDMTLFATMRYYFRCMIHKTNAYLCLSLFCLSCLALSLRFRTETSFLIDAIFTAVSTKNAMFANHRITIGPYKYSNLLLPEKKNPKYGNIKRSVTTELLKLIIRLQKKSQSVT